MRNFCRAATSLSNAGTIWIAPAGAVGSQYSIQNTELSSSEFMSTVWFLRLRISTNSSGDPLGPWKRNSVIFRSPLAIVGFGAACAAGAAKAVTPMTPVTAMARRVDARGERTEELLVGDGRRQRGNALPRESDPNLSERQRSTFRPATFVHF